VDQSGGLPGFFHNRHSVVYLRFIIINASQ
jgi:hypothetical protein